MRVCRNLFDHADVGVMSNNIEKKFGLSAFFEKFLFIGPEIKGDAQIEQAEFQSIVSGETLQIAVKFKTAQTVEWRTPGILAGNELPAWVDNSGSVNRRIVLFEFPHKVENGDMELGKKLDAEMPAILFKANRAYLWATRRFARDNVWKHLPRAFHRAKEEFAEDANSIVNFLGAGKLAYGADNYMPKEDFVGAYHRHVEAMGLTRIRLTKQSLHDPLLGRGCRVVNRSALYPRTRSGTMMTCEFVVGADFAELPPGRAGFVEEEDPLGD